ncbi:hypothetical protein NU219Hw_g6278t1 [Hortaea werneckii]
MRPKNDLLKLATLLLAAARVEAQSGHVELCTVQVYQTCGTPTLTKTLSFSQSFSYVSNITSTMVASSSSAPSSGGCSTCSTSSSVSSYIEPSVPASSISIAPPSVSTTPVLSTSGSVTFTSTPSPSSSPTSSLLFIVCWAASNLHASSGTQCFQLGDIYVDTITNPLFFIGGSSSGIYASSRAQYFQLSDIHLHTIPDYFLFLRGASSHLHSSSSTEHIKRNHLHFDAISDPFLFVRGTTSYLHSPTGAQYFKLGDLHLDAFANYFFLIRGSSSNLYAPSSPDAEYVEWHHVYLDTLSFLVFSELVQLLIRGSTANLHSSDCHQHFNYIDSYACAQLYERNRNGRRWRPGFAWVGGPGSYGNGPGNCYFKDDNGIDYTVRCNADTTGGGVGNSYATTNSANSFEECFTICDGYPTCQGFVWLGALNSYGSGPGNCYFKGADPGQTIAFVNSDSAHFAAIKVNQGGPVVVPPAITTTTTTTTTSSSSSVAIVVPPTTTTTTTTTSTSSSSTITSRVIYTPPPPSQISTSVSSTTSITFPSQPARLSCARQGYLVQNFNWFVVEIATGNTVQNGSIQGGIPMQAMGYNRCDGLIYATDQEAHLVRFGLDLTPQRLYERTFFRYQTGEVDNDCQYWAIRTADNDVARWIHVDVNPASPVYGSIVGQGELAVPQYFYADWAYVPGAGSYLWSVGIDQPTANAYLYRFDQATLTSIIVASFGDIGLADFRPDPASGYRLNFGAVYASADGYLYGSENISGNIYRFTVTAPYNWQFLVRGPGTVQNDGARCIDNTEAIGTY